MAHPKVATIVPLNHLEETKDDDYLMALSYLTDNEDYMDFFYERSEEGKYVILDNSAIEMGCPEPFEEYLNKAMDMKVSEIMFPDYFQDPESTLREAIRCIKIVRDHKIRMRIMVIPQGRDMMEWFQSARDLLKVRALGQYISDGFWEPTTIGISYRYTEMFSGSRVNIFWLLNSILPNFQKIHLLGCSADPRKEIVSALAYPFVRGVDSSYPCVFTSHDLIITEQTMASEMRPPRNIDFINDLYDVDLLQKNMKVWRDACLNHSE